MHDLNFLTSRRVAPGTRPALRAQGQIYFLVLTCALSGAMGMLAVPARGANAPLPQTQNLKDADVTILTVFAAKCSACHGPELAKPKKGFGYCLDLQRMAANPKLVVPLKPEKSKLYTTIESDDMPPAPEDDGVPLTKAEKDMVLAALKTWIAAGAPANDGGAPAAAPPTASFTKRTLTLAGKFHPLIAHFPIALLVAAAVAELVWLRTRQAWLTGVVRFCTLFGAAGAVLTATLGWVDAYRLFPNAVLIVTPIRVIVAVVLTLAAAAGEFAWLRTRPVLVRVCVLFGWFAILAIAASLISWHDTIRYPAAAPNLTILVHRWLGTAGALWAIPVLLLSERGFKRRLGNPEAGDPRPWFSLMLFAGVGLIGLAAHFGGGLVYGTDYLSW